MNEVEHALPSRWKTHWATIIGIPIIVVVVFVGWLIWWNTASFDQIEARPLAAEKLLQFTREHLYLTFVSAIAVVVIGVPLGIALTRRGMRKYADIIVAFANAGQAAPMLGVLVLLAIAMGFGSTTAIVALTIYALLPVLSSTITGLTGVDKNLIEAAQGMGMSRTQVLTKVELPLAVPTIMAGIRIAVVLLVGTATFATFVDAGGLGVLITTGVSLFRYSVLVTGSLLVALLALTFDWIGRMVELFFTPRGLV